MRPDPDAVCPDAVRDLLELALFDDTHRLSYGDALEPSELSSQLLAMCYRSLQLSGKLVLPLCCVSQELTVAQGGACGFVSSYLERLGEQLDL